jgi:hypothetical protein
MQYDLFISYARRDNTRRRISDLVAQIQADYRAFTGGDDLPVFFDTEEIRAWTTGGIASSTV